MTDRLRVAMVGPYPVGRNLSNGVEAVTVGVVDLLSRRDDIDVHVVTAVFGGSDETIEQDGITIHTVGSSDRWRRITFYRGERTGISRTIGRIAPDVVHAQGANFYGLGAMAAGLPTVTTLHGMLFKEASIVDPAMSRVEQAKSRVRGYFNARFERQVLQRAEHIITISGYVNASISGRTHAKLHAIANPIGSEFFDVADRAEPGRLLCVARIEPRKGQLHLVEAVRLLADRGVDVNLRLVGKHVDAGYTEAVREAIARHDLGDRITLTGIVTDAEMLDEYERASIAVMSSREETSPMAFQQAMAGGTACIGPANAGIPYLIDDGENGLLVRGDDLGSGLADAIQKVVSDDDLRATLSRGGRATAERRFRADEVGNDTVAVYRELLATATT